MLRALFPYNYVEDVFVIDYQKLYDKGFRAIIFDIDQTLVQHGEEATPEVENLFKTLQTIGFKTFILSNNSPERIEAFLTNINDTGFIGLADKPRPDQYLSAIKQLSLPKECIIFIGDQIFTDVLGANRVGIASILVKFLRHPHEINIGKKRKLESLFLKVYVKSKRYYNRLGTITKVREH